MDNKIHILGAGKLSECAVDILFNENNYSEIYIYDDNTAQIQIGNKVLKVSGTIQKGKEEIIKHNDDYFVALGVNNREMALEIITELIDNGKKPINIISKNAHISTSASIGYNCLIFPGVVIGCNVSIGNLLICYSNSSIEHHIKIGNGVVVCPRVAIASNVLVGDFCFLGISATISNNVAIGKNSIIGAGALVIHTINESSLAYGIPAKSKLINKRMLL